MKREKNKLQIRNSTAEFLIFTRQAGEDGIEVRVAEETVWLTSNPPERLRTTASRVTGLSRRRRRRRLALLTSCARHGSGKPKRPALWVCACA